MLRKIFGPKRNKVTGEWRRLHNEEVNALYSYHYYSGDQIKKNELGGACGTHGGQEKCIQGYCGRADGKRPGVDGTIILRGIFGMRRPGLDWSG